MDPIQVWRGKHGDPVPLFGPLPGLRDGDVIAYEWELPEAFAPWPGRTRVERTYVLLGLGISLCNPTWREVRMPDGRRIEGLGAARDQPDCWYVDLSSVAIDGDAYVVRDLYIDVIVPLDGRPYRMLDLDEFADAIEDGTLAVADAMDGLRRWQGFLDGHLHGDREADASWTDFPPAAIEALARVPRPIGDVVRWSF